MNQTQNHIWNMIPSGKKYGDKNVSPTGLCDWFGSHPLSLRWGAPGRGRRRGCGAEGRPRSLSARAPAPLTRSATGPVGVPGRVAVHSRFCFAIKYSHSHSSRSEFQKKPWNSIMMIINLVKLLNYHVSRKYNSDKRNVGVLIISEDFWQNFVSTEYTKNPCYFFWKKSLTFHFTIIICFHCELFLDEKIIGPTFSFNILFLKPEK